jgi:hypothetical protein
MQWTQGLSMSFVFLWTVCKLARARNRFATQAVAVIGFGDNRDKLPGAGFPLGMTKVTGISVDTAGREVPLSGQEGMCVQWR